LGADRHGSAEVIFVLRLAGCFGTMISSDPEPGRFASNDTWQLALDT
jgi:hypothetical protein